MIAKAIIVLVAFPLFVHAMFTAGTMLLGLLLPSTLAMAGSWAEILRKVSMGAAFLVAVRGSFGVCRRLWPTPPVH